MLPYSILLRIRIRASWILFHYFTTHIRSKVLGLLSIVFKWVVNPCNAHHRRNFLLSISEWRMMHFLLGIGFLQEGAPELLRIHAVREDGDPISKTTTNSQLFFTWNKLLTRNQCCRSGYRIRCFLDSWIWDAKKICIRDEYPDNFSEGLETVFWVTNI